MTGLVEARFAAAERYRSTLADAPGILALAASACQVPMAALKVVGDGSAHFAATLGFQAVEHVPHSISLCELVSACDDAMVLHDATRDARLAAHPLVRGTEQVRFVGAAPLHHDGQIVGALCVFDDSPDGHDSEATSSLLAQIAKRVDTETSLRHRATSTAFPAAADQSEVVAAISHEIRTPLAAIRGNIELLTGTVDLPPAAAKRLDTVVRNTDRLCRTVDNLLRAVDLQSHDPVGIPVPTDLVTVAAQAVAECGEQAARIHLDLPGSPVMVFADARLLRIVTGHLLHNALIFGDPERPVVVTISGGRRPALTVRDHGPGLREDELAKAVLPFFRGERAGREQIPGLGLGLSISRRIVGSQHGTLHLENNPGGGLTARITLPAA